MILCAHGWRGYTDRTGRVSGPDLCRRRGPRQSGLAGIAAGVCAVIVDVACVEFGDRHDDQDIRRAELMIDHGTVADESAEAQIPFDQRRQGAQGFLWR